MKIGGAAKGKSSTYSPSWADGHRKVKKTLDGIDKTVKQIKSDRPKDTAKRMAKAAAKRAREQGDKIISDVTGVGRKTNRQGKGSKAARRMEKIQLEDKQIQENILGNLTKLAGTAAKAIKPAAKTKSFMKSITTNQAGADKATTRAPKLNVDKNIKYSERDVDSSTSKEWHDGLI